ncbi:MAG: hypothetical protein EA422_14360 [Gemmatimonadales bacterium]|nr:MAG: hypothetical protein EA422_14360 [Gemmatimonadales bacterium]
MGRSGLVRLGVALVVVLGLSAPTGCAGEGLRVNEPEELDGSGEPLPAGGHEVRVWHDGMDRYALVRIPPAAEGAGAPLPLVLAFHGGSGNAEQFRRTNGLEALAVSEGFILVHPQGIGLLDARIGRLGTWNVGFCCGRAGDLGVDDVGFVERLLDELERRTPVDRSRVFATGHSNGGMLSFRLAEQLPERIRGIAPVGGAALPEEPPAQPVALLHIHSRDDPRALYEGGLGPPFPLTGRRVQHPSVPQVLDRWLEANECEGDPAVLETRTAPPPQPTDPTEGADAPDAPDHEAELLAWPGCRDGHPVRHWRLTGAGHGWPGDVVPNPLSDVMGTPSTVIHAATEIWDFFREF